MNGRETEQRFPIWVSKMVGTVFFVLGLLFAPGVWQSFQYNGFSVESVYTAAVWLLSVAVGLALLFSKKGWPRTWHDMALLFRQAREEPDGLSEALSPEERLEHLEIMRGQGVLSQEEYEEKRKEILKDL